ncbi:hypothetical protein K3495_g7938 [Podosphaera aphanis]|nr:hypothetical protein K3495_g7938 [Podosphaera aphanis]
MARYTGVQRLRGDESWVDVSIQPSPSPHSLIGNEIVTTGLRVQQSSPPDFRRRRGHPGISLSSTIGAQSTSSHEEYEESDSDEDCVLTSSNEQLTPATLETPPIYDAELESDRDRRITSLSQRANLRQTFTPQPNAFSHPPSNQHYHSSDNCFSNARHSNRAQNIHSHQSYHSPVDHEAALRASLTTLLSIGAATARSLPKREVTSVGTIQNYNEPIGLRLVSETDLMAPDERGPHFQQQRSSDSTINSNCSSDGALVDKKKRKVTSEEKMWRLKKNKGEHHATPFPPTLFTWAMSAGVLVLISVVGFGAGYMIGRGAGREELVTKLNNSGLADGITCGREAIKNGSGGFKRFKLGISGSSRSIFL